MPTYLMHFWQGIPEHLLCLFDSDVVIDVMAYCDTMLYNSLLDVLIPATMQEVSDQWVALYININMKKAMYVDKIIIYGGFTRKILIPV